ncbi:MAG: pyridoxamine 5'-phosphate oxidase family protein [Syntrophomonas sp.]|nr:pyridoxamine 5'-phosphate oxidase family protein [Syntrophomonas sp.]
MEKHKMRKFERQMDNEEALSRLQKGLYGVLSTVDNNGQPYGVPLNYVIRENALYFHSAVEGHKLDNIKYNNKVAFTVVGSAEILARQFSTAYDCVVLFGIISLVKDEQEKRQVLMDLVNKYSPEFAEEGTKYVANSIDRCVVLKIAIQSLTGKQRLKSL